MNKPTPRNQVIRPVAIPPSATLGDVTIWQTYPWAPAWFADALNEARSTAKGDERRHARRREILFSVCCAESYLFEWVLASVLRGRKRAFQELLELFPPDDRRGIKDGYKEVPKELRRRGFISRTPDLGGPHGKDWLRLVGYRDGLVHASASRPYTPSLPEERQPVPWVPELDELPPGWAVKVVVERIRRLHAASETPSPEWLTEP